MVHYANVYARCTDHSSVGIFMLLQTADQHGGTPHVAFRRVQSNLKMSVCDSVHNVKHTVQGSERHSVVLITNEVRGTCYIQCLLDYTVWVR